MRLVRFYRYFYWKYSRCICFSDSNDPLLRHFCFSLWRIFLGCFVNQLGKKLLNRGEQYELNQQFVGYAMVVTFVLDIISGLFSISILHWILQFYTVFVVYEGARTLMKVEEAKLTRYTLIASVIVIVCPALIAAVFNELSVILN